jgi:GST-like protein
VAAKQEVFNMIDLYYWPTPNGWKASIMLEECGLPYEVHAVHIGRGDQFKPEFLAISPNNRIPAIVDRDVDRDALDGEISVFESGAVLVYLAEKSGRLLPADLHARFDALQWLFWQTGGLGPMAGQLGHFRNYAQESIDYAVQRYADEYNRLLGVMDRRLADRDYLAGDYSIADISAWPWVRSHEHLGQPLDEFANLRHWFDSIAARPAVKRGIEVGMDWWGERKLDDDSRKNLFGQTASQVEKLAQQAARKQD